jgi:hypothetical protein
MQTFMTLLIVGLLWLCPLVAAQAPTPVGEQSVEQERLSSPRVRSYGYKSV